MDNHLRFQLLNGCADIFKRGYVGLCELHRWWQRVLATGRTYIERKDFAIWPSFGQSSADG
jgi:hypothetical protein